MPVQQAGSVLGLRLAMAPEEEGPALRGRQLLRTQNGPLALPPFILILLWILILLFLHLIISSPSLLGDGRRGWFGVLVGEEVFQKYVIYGTRCCSTFCQKAMPGCHMRGCGWKSQARPNASARMLSVRACYVRVT